MHKHMFPIKNGLNITNVLHTGSRHTTVFLSYGGGECLKRILTYFYIPLNIMKLYLIKHFGGWFGILNIQSNINAHTRSVHAKSKMQFNLNSVCQLRFRHVFTR